MDCLVVPKQTGKRKREKIDNSVDMVEGQEQAVNFSDEELVRGKKNKVQQTQLNLLI